MFLFYVLTYTIGIFFQAAIIASANERLTGGDPTVRSALGAAWSTFGAIVMWGPQDPEDDPGAQRLVGRIVAGLLGAAWSLATFFVVPVLVLPVLVLDEKQVGASFLRSWGLVKETRGEAVIGGGGIGLASILFLLPLGLLVTVLAKVGIVGLPIATGVAGGAPLLVCFAALQSVYVAAHYRYATTRAAPEGFGAAEIEGAFRRK